MATENSDDIRLIVKIAQLYYEQDMTQAQIARELGIYRTTISRLLKRGREQGIVTIAINYDYNENLWLEQQLKQKFGCIHTVLSLILTNSVITVGSSSLLSIFCSEIGRNVTSPLNLYVSTSYKLGSLDKNAPFVISGIRHPPMNNPLQKIHPMTTNIPILFLICFLLLFLIFSRFFPALPDISPQTTYIV